MIVVGASHPNGSKSLADSERITRFVTLLVNGAFTLKEKVSELGIHWIPNIFY